METRLRWLLIQAGLPRPEVQTNLGDGSTRFFGRADLCYPEARLVLEYDGVNHRERLVEDGRRQNLMINAGFRLLRFTATSTIAPTSWWHKSGLRSSPQRRIVGATDAPRPLFALRVRGR